MRRLIAPFVVAAFAVGCGERSLTPTSPLSPGAASLAFGNPPPPPVSGGGRADLDVFDGESSLAASCDAHTTFTFSWDYFVNKPGNNAFLHITIDGHGHDVSIHQTNKKIDVKGDISGAGFTFSISDAISGGIMDSESHVPSNILLQLTGQLKTDDGATCTANATLHASLTGTGDPIGDVP